MGVVLIKVHGLYGVSCEKISGGVGKSFLVIIDLSREMAPKLDPGMTNGMGIRFERTFS